MANRCMSFKGRAVREALLLAFCCVLLLPAGFSGMEQLRWAVLSASGMHPFSLRDSVSGDTVRDEDPTAIWAG